MVPSTDFEMPRGRVLHAELRSMRVNAEALKRDEAYAKSNIKSIEAQAAEQYARDKVDAKAHLTAVNGSWERDAGSGYLYNAVQRYYYDTATGIYYGGEPAVWTQEPKMPLAARHASSAAEDGDELKAAAGAPPWPSSL